MRMLVLCETLALVFVVLNYILKCLEYKDLRDLFDNRGKSIKMLNDEVKAAKIKHLEALNNEFNTLVKYKREINQLKHKVYVLRKDINRKDRAIVRYKEQNKVFKHGYHESEKRCADLRGIILPERIVSNYYKSWYKIMQNERDAYLYCLRQIQEEVKNAKKE